MTALLAYCPWSNLAPSNFPICEESVCSWIRQPGNTASNLAFFAVGLYLIFRSKKNGHDLGFGLCALLIGFCSTIAHASVTKFFSFFDFAAIFSLFSLVAAKNLISQRRAPAGEISLFSTIFIASLGTLYIFEVIRVLLFIGFVVALLIWERSIIRKSLLGGDLLKILALFAVGGIAIALDSSGTVCDPQQHFFQLHMVWHCAMALNVLFLANHFRATRLTNPSARAPRRIPR